MTVVIQSVSGRNSILVAAVLLTALVTLVFLPAVRFEFVDFDVHDQVIDNPHIRGLTVENVKHILTSRCVTSYYPVRTLTFALDYQVWGLEPGGFKLTNLLIHLANVLLVFWLALRLFEEPVSNDGSAVSRQEAVVGAFAAGLFAVHPIVVEPVVWVPGREELLMTLGALGCLHFHLTARHLGSVQGKAPWRLACYAAAALSCGAACLSNAVGAVIPAMVTALDLATLTRPTLWRILRGTTALWAIGIATFVVKQIGNYVDPIGEPLAASWNRAAMVLEVYWLNLKSLLWPTDLAAFHLEDPPESFAEPSVILGGVAVVATCAIAWMLRKRLALVGIAWFLIALAPSAQVMPHHLHRADRFLYLPLVGLAVALATGARPWAAALTRSWQIRATVMATSLLLMLAVTSMVQLRTWVNGFTMWENCLRVDPENGMAHCMLADNLAESGQYGRAIQHYEYAIRSPRWAPMAGNQLALLLATCEDEGVRDYERAIHFATQAWLENPKYIRTVTGVYAHSANDRARRGDFLGAIEHFRKAIRIHPANRPALLELAKLLATCDERRLRNPQDAVQFAERACRIRGRLTPDDLRILAAAYAADNRFDMAAATTQRATALAEAAGNDTLANRLRLQGDDDSDKPKLPKSP